MSGSERSSQLASLVETNTPDEGVNPPVMGREPQLIEPHEARLAMAAWGTNRHCHLAKIQRRHFSATATACRLHGGAEPIIERVLGALPGVIAATKAELPPGFPARVAAPILNGLRHAAERLEAMPPA